MFNSNVSLPEGILTGNANTHMLHGASIFTYKTGKVVDIKYPRFVWFMMWMLTVDICDLSLTVKKQGTILPLDSYEYPMLFHFFDMFTEPTSSTVLDVIKLMSCEQCGKY